MFVPFILLSVIFCASFSHAEDGTGKNEKKSAPPPITPCKADDTSCMIAATKSFYRKLLAGDNSIGAEPIEPMFIDEIDGAQTILKYKMTDTTITGFSKCQLKDLKHEKSQQTFVIKMTCPHIDIAGNYVMDGKLIALPVKGKGKYSLAVDTYDTALTASYKIITDDSGKQHLSIKSYQAEAVPVKGVKFDFQNMFDGKKDLANTVQKFANDNWKEVTVQFQGPIINLAFKKLIKNANKFLKAMSMDKVFL